MTGRRDRQTEEDKIGFSPEFQIPEGEIERVDARIETKQEVRDRRPFSEVLMIIDVARLSSYYQWKILLPLIILAAVFWMMGDGLADRMSVSLTGILTIVAYQFIRWLFPTSYFRGLVRLSVLYLLY